jgi:hypothetical protein
MEESRLCTAAGPHTHPANLAEESSSSSLEPQPTSLKQLGRTLSGSGINNNPSFFGGINMGSHEIIDCEKRKDSETSSGTTATSSSKKPVQDSEDSSYDSDCEVSDGTTHYDVSRTVSDTLGQEFAEYVTIAETGDALLSRVRHIFYFIQYIQPFD